MADALFVDVLLLMGCCVGCVRRCCSKFCECMNGAVCIIFALSVYISDEPSVCCVCGYI